MARLICGVGTHFMSRYHKCDSQEGQTVLDHAVTPNRHRASTGASSAFITMRTDGQAAKGGQNFFMGHLGLLEPLESLFGRHLGQGVDDFCENGFSFTA